VSGTKAEEDAVGKPRELEPGVDPEEEPSARWGWHGSFPRASLIAGWSSVVILLTFLIGNHQGRVENIWVIGLAAAMAYGLVRHSLRKRHTRRF